MDRTAYIRAEALRKVYQLREFQATTLKEMVLKNLFTREQVREHVALDGISFELGPGRSLGVIGPNGSGKSTLLKLAAGIIQPTSGTMEVRGRVASFLELGAGFHPEFTGMENIFLQGRILGLSRKEILSQLEGIIEFSGLGDFIHTPTKRYSTGMTVRLGFAIAAYFDADLMLVDEVLAVGDGAFQTQCMDRINQMRREGKSFLFVSHDLSQIEMVADEVLWLDHGRPRMFGKTEEVLQAFEREMQGLLLNEGPQTAVDDMSAALMATVRQGTGEIVIRGVELVRRDGRPARRFPYGEPIVARIDLEVVDPMPEVEIWLSIGNAESRRVAMTHSGQEMLREIPPFVFHNLEKGRHRVVAELDPPRLPPGHYLVSCSVNRAGDPWHFCDIHLRLYRFTVEIPVGKPEEGGEITEREESRSPQKPKRTPLPLYEPPAIWEE